MNEMNRAEFVKGALAVAGVAMCPCALKAAGNSYSLINANAVVCGTCQHWRGERHLVDQGKRVKCQSIPAGACFRGPGFKYPPMSSAQSHGCAGKFYKRWSSLP